MSPKIGLYGSPVKSIQYNEKKVSLGTATCLAAENFLKDHDQLTLQEKLDRFEQRTSLNDIALTKAIHISLNFGTTENLSDDMLLKVAKPFMKEIGFEDQPWLAYRHFDAGHPHLHIVTTNIRADGSRIRLGPADLARAHAIGKQLEHEFSLQHRVKTTPADQERFAVSSAQKVIYGEPGLKHSVSNVLNTVIDHYRYTNLDELNAVLRLYNVTANPGEEGSRLRRLHGLLYHTLDESGNRIGVPLKASGFLLKPTLNRLEQRFIANQSEREFHAENLRAAIDWSLAGEAPTWDKLKSELDQKGITAVMSRSTTDSKDQLYFVDHNQKAVFNANALGKAYSLESLQERCSPSLKTQQQEELQIHEIKLRL